MKQLRIKDIVYAYDDEKRAVDGVSIDVHKGAYVTIIGHNGSGKSTIAKCIVGLLEIQAGEIVVDGVQLTPENVYDIREKIAIVFQNPDNQFIGSTVKDDIAFGLENRSLDPAAMDPIIEKFAARVGMLDYLNHEPTKLSGGQKQRVAIAGALALNPELLVLDEATSMLDPKGRHEINELVHELHTKNRMTIVSITHDIEEVALSDYVVVMNGGRVAMQGTPMDILQHTQTLIDLKLDIPFSVKFYEALRKQGVKASHPYDLEGLVASLWP